MLGYIFLSGNWWHSLFQKILLFLDSVVYWAVSMCYQLFVKLATFRLFEDSFFSEFASRIYSILGVFMLFYLAYALLNALIDPEKITGDKGVSKIASNLVISLILLGLVPTIFDYAYRLQNYVLSSNIIGAIILGSSPTDPQSDSDSNSEISGDETMIKFGDSLAFTVLNTFVNPDNYNVKAANNYTWYDFKIEVLEESNYSNLPSFSDAVVGEQVIVGSNEEAAITYYGFISTATGVFLIYILLSFTLDLGVRVIKLAFCQLIAPIPIIMRVMPSKKSTFDKWVKTSLAVFFEVFTRVALMYIAVYFIQAIWEYNIFRNFSGILGKLAMVVIILGIFAFAKQAPKMLSDMLGIESGNLKLGIGEKLKAGGFLGAAIGGFGGSLVGAATGGIGGAFGSLVNGGGFAGFTYGLANGWKSKGMQFGNQRQNYYREIIHGKGRAGIFGGQAFVDKMVDDQRKATEKSYIQTRNEAIKNFENSALYRNKMEEFASIQRSSRRQDYDSALSNYNRLKSVFDQNNSFRNTYEHSAEYQGLLSRFENDAISKAEAEMQQAVRDGKYAATAEGRAQYQRDRENLINSYQKASVSSELRRLQSIGAISNEGSQYLSAIDSYSADREALREAQNVMTAARNNLNNIDMDLAKRQTDEFMRESDDAKALGKAVEEYRSNVEYVRDREMEAAIKKYKKSQAGQEQIAAIQEAMKLNDQAAAGRGGGSEKQQKKS